LEDPDDAQPTLPDGFLRPDPISDVILRTALHEERNFPLSCPRFSAVQTDVHPKQREAVVKWLTQLTHGLKFHGDALSNALMTFDLISMQMPIPKAEIQIYAAVCACLAIKVDARMRPSAEQLNAITGVSLTNAEMVAKEVEILQTVGFKLSYPTVKFHVRIFLDALKPGPAVADLANFFAEVGLTKFEFLNFRQSIIGLAAIFLAAAMIGQPHVAMNAVLISHCTEKEELVKCIGLMKETVSHWNRPVAKEMLGLLGSVDFGVGTTPFAAMVEDKMLPIGPAI
jgi:hypothetical protein